jgi:thimet oligopeptidase
MTEQVLIRKPDWTVAPEKMRSLADDDLGKAKKRLDEIAKTPAEEVNLETLLEFEEVIGSDFPLGYILFIKHVAVDKAQRDMADDIEKEVRKFVNEVWGRKDLYDVLVQLEPQIDSFDSEERMLLDKTLKQFRHRGAALDDDKRKEFLEIANNISILESDFQRVLNEITTTVPFTKEELQGVPPPVYEPLEKDGEKYLCPLDYPVYIPVVYYAKNSETRKRMMLTYYQRGGAENSQRLSDALALRDRQAKLLGFSNFADYVISMKMAKTPQRVFDFMNDLKTKLSKLSEKETTRLRELKSKENNTQLEETTMDLWDIFYYHEMLMKELYAVDQNEVKEYFPIDSVIKGVLDVYQLVLNLDFKEVDNPNVWYNDVREFIVTDKTNGRTLGVFYLDLYPRDGKFKHYAMFNFLDRRVKDGTTYLPICALVTNFDKPTKDRPSLLNHNDVETFFHEFGHVMHVISNQTDYVSFGLGGVLSDFGETPSMMFENWAWKEEILTKLSGHYKNPEKKLPSDLLKRMIDAKLLDIGTLQLRQVAYSLIDMTYHTEGAEDTSKVFRKIFEEITGYEMPDDTRMDAGFGHLMSSLYTAGYYTYLWSKAYAEDIFTKFETNGFMNPDVGTEYRRKILAPGGSLDPDDMVKSFLGREMNTDAFMKSLGLDWT